MYQRIFEVLEKRVCLAGTTIPFSDPDLISVADFNLDSKADIVSVVNNAATQSASIQLRLGDGDGQFAAPSLSNVDFPVSDVVAGGTLAGPGFMRQTVLITETPIPDTEFVSIRAANVIEGGGLRQITFSQLVFSEPAPPASDRWLMADATDDGIPDLIRFTSDRVSAFPGQPNGTFQFSCMISFPFNPGVSDFVTGDFNGDGNADLAGRLGATVHISKGTSFGFFFEDEQITFGEGALASLSAGDIDADGRADLIAAFANGSITTAFGDTAMAFTRRFREPDAVMGNVARVFTSTIDKDGHADLFGLRPQGNGTAAAVMARGDGLGNFSPFGAATFTKARSIRAELTELA